MPSPKQTEETWAKTRLKARKIVPHWGPWATRLLRQGQWLWRPKKKGGKRRCTNWETSVHSWGNFGRQNQKMKATLPIREDIQICVEIIFTVEEKNTKIRLAIWGWWIKKQLKTRDFDTPTHHTHTHTPSCPPHSLVYMGRPCIMKWSQHHHSEKKVPLNQNCNRSYEESSQINLQVEFFT